MWQALLCSKIEKSEVLETSNVGKIKALGRTVKNYEDLIWNGFRQIMIYKELVENFRQNEELKEKLLATKQDILAECAVQEKSGELDC